MNQNFPFEHFLNTQSIDIQEDNKTEKPQAPHSTEQVDDGFDLSELKEVHTAVLAQLKEMISAQKFNAYFADTFSLQTIGDTSIKFAVTTQFIKTMIEQHYADFIQIAIQNVLAKRFEIEIIVADVNKGLSSNQQNILNSLNEHKITSFSSEILAPNADKKKPKSVKEATFTLDLTPTSDDLINKVESAYMEHMDEVPTGQLIDPKKTFESFIVGPSNNMAFATALAVAKEPARPGIPGRYPSLYIHSNSGLGKTHLLHGIGNAIKDRHPSLIVCLVTAREFMKELINAIQEKTLPIFQKKYSEKIDVLMIDDIHELKNKHGTQNEFFHIFNELHNKGKQLIFTSDKLPTEIDGIAERIKTRLQWGLVIDIQRPDLETRIAILKRKATELDLFLSDDILNLIASRVKTSIRELEGSLIKLSAYADVMKVEIDEEMVKDLLKLSEDDETKALTIEAVAKAASQHFKIPLADLKSKARTKEITKARHIAMYLSQKLVHATLIDIGIFYGGRDHTSVIHGIRKVTDLLKTDSSLSRDILNIENAL